MKLTRLVRPGVAPITPSVFCRIARPAVAGVLLSAAVALVFAGCGVIPAPPAESGRELPPLDNLHVVEAGQAYRSAQLDAATLTIVVETYGIRTVINLRGENAGQPWYDDEVATCQSLGVTHVDIRMSANALPPRAELLKLYDTFLSAEYPILMHCQAGADRAGAAAAIWRMLVMGDDRATASQQLSLEYGHIAVVTPEMDQLVAMFQPARNWILNEYPVP